MKERSFGGRRGWLAAICAVAIAMALSLFGAGLAFASETTGETTGSDTETTESTTEQVTVIFDANGGEGTMTALSVDKGASVTLTSIDGAITRDGAEFACWNTEKDGSGTDYADGATIDSLYSDITLYAQWNITIRFDPYGGAGTMENQTARAGKAVTLSENQFTQEGKKFAGWKDSDGNSYSDAQEVTFTKDTTLYAQWVEDVTITFDANGGEGTMDKQVTSRGVDTVLNANAYTRENYVFVGWNTAADGSGQAFGDGATVKLDGDVTLYAQWSAYATVSFDANGGEGTMDSINVAVSQSSQLPANTFTREGYTFAGWNTKADGTGTLFSDEAVIAEPTENITLFAQWTENANVKDIEITYDANGGTSDEVEATFTETAKSGIATNLDQNPYTREGFVFQGWNTKADGTGTNYATDDVAVFTEDTTLYANWKPILDFIDTPADAWYITPINYISWVNNAGIMIGYTDEQGNATGLFGPEDTLTRGQVATILYRLANEDASATTDPSKYVESETFKDVADYQYYTAAIEWCYDNKIVNGYKDANGEETGYFDPESPVTREQLATMLWRFAGWCESDNSAAADLSEWPDGDKVSDYAKDAVAWAAAEGIMTGKEMPNGSKIFDPQDGATRAEAAKMFYMFNSFMEKGE